MRPQKRLYGRLTILLLATLAVSCGEMNKANKLLAEGDAAVKEADRLAQESEEKINQLHAGRSDFPGNRDQLKETAQQAIDLIERGVTKLREAAAKYDEASKTKIDAQLKEYISLRSQEWSKHAEHLEVLKNYPKAILDSSVNSARLDETLDSMRAQVEKLQGEWRDLRARAAAIREQNKDKFENTN